MAKTDVNGARVFNLFRGKAMKNENNNKTLSHIPTPNDPAECGLFTCMRIIICLPYLSVFI